MYRGDRHVGQFGDGYSAAMRLRLQDNASPSVSRTRWRVTNVSQRPIAVDLRVLLKGFSRIEAWDWAISNLLPHASKKTVFNLNHYRVPKDPSGFLHDKQSNATRSSIDYVVQQNAFVLDLESHSSRKAGATAPWGVDDQLIERVFSTLDPLFDAFGWADDEFSWTNETSHFGGTILCSFASPNLSFWAHFPLVGNAARARKLPENDRGIKLNRSKYYVMFETNEGDTPRVLASNMCSAWALPERGSVPVAWAIDPLLAERFPALFDYYASTAGPNDSFVAEAGGLLISEPVGRQSAQDIWESRGSINGDVWTACFRHLRLRKPLNPHKICTGCS